MNVQRVTRILLALALFLALGSCAENPATGRANFVMMSEAEEIRTGQQADAEIRKEYGVYDAPALQAYVDRVGQSLAAHSHRPGLKYRFVVVDSPEINAFALPGGYIYITRGILAYLDSEAELAAVLAHEIGHVTARHSVQQYSAAMAANIGLTIGSILIPELRNQGAQSLLNVFGGALLSGYGREHELEADRLGADYLAKSGYDPQAMVRVISVLKDQETFDAAIAREEGREPRKYHGLFATHPDNDTRLKEIVAAAGQNAAGPRNDNRQAYYRALDGMIFGDSPAQGMLRGARFYHPDMGFVVDFPAGWPVSNRPEQVGARSPDGQAIVALQATPGTRESPMAIIRGRVRLDPGFSSENTSINGLPAVVVRGRSQGRPLIIAAIPKDDHTYVLMGTARSVSSFSQNESAISRTIHSFRPFSEGDRAAARPYRLEIVKAQPGTRFAALAQKSPLDRHAEGYLRLINHAYPAGEPTPGQLLKIIQ